MQLTPQQIADYFTITQIDAKIVSLLAKIDIAESSVKDVFGDMQANQSTERQSLDKLNESLAVWLAAANILNGTDSSTANLTSFNYNPSVPKV